MPVQPPRFFPSALAFREGDRLGAKLAKAVGLLLVGALCVLLAPLLIFAWYPLTRRRRR